MACQTSNSKSATLNPRTTRYEFLGPVGAFLIVIGVPATMYGLYFGCSEQTGGCSPAFDATAVGVALSSWTWWKGLWDTEAALAYLVWYAYVVVAWLVLPGEWIEGTVMRDGRRKKYKINGTCLQFPLDCADLNVHGVSSVPHCITGTRCCSWGLVPERT